jgi:predicted acyltransferase
MNAEYIGSRLDRKVSKACVLAGRDLLSRAAAIFALLALLTWLVALYTWLEPDYGASQALNIVGGVLAVIALVLISAAMIVGRASSRRH